MDFRIIENLTFLYMHNFFFPLVYMHTLLMMILSAADRKG